MSVINRVSLSARMADAANTSLADLVAYCKVNVTLAGAFEVAVITGATVARYGAPRSCRKAAR